MLPSSRERSANFQQNYNIMLCRLQCKIYQTAQYAAMIEQRVLISFTYFHPDENGLCRRKSDGRVATPERTTSSIQNLFLGRFVSLRCAIAHNRFGTTIFTLVRSRSSVC